MAYNYDLISGKVNQVSYQPGLADGFYHQYSYDAENRITKVSTSTDSMEWQNDASLYLLPAWPAGTGGNRRACNCRGSTMPIPYRAG